MTIETAIDLSLAAMAGVVALALCTLIVVKSSRERRERRHEDLVVELRPLLIQSLDDGDASAMLHLDGHRGAVVETLATSLLGKLRGADRANLVGLLEERGVIERARNDLTARRAARRLRGVDLLGSAGDETSIDALRRLLHDRDGDVRSAAARALGRIGAPTAIADMLQAHDDDRLPAHVVTMATMRTGTSSIPPVVAALADPSVRVRTLAASLSGVLGATEAVDQLTPLLDEDDRDLRRAAATALGRLGHPRAVGALSECLARELDRPDHDLDIDLARTVIDALGRLSHPAATAVLESVLGRRHRLSVAAAAALAELGPRRERRRGAPSADDPAVAPAPTPAVTPAVTPVEADVPR